MSESFNHNASNNVLVNKILHQIIEKNNASNAYIFYGPENIGKKDSAHYFISQIIKQNNFNDQCLLNIKNNNHPDYLMIEPTYLSGGKLINQSKINSEMIKKNHPLIRIDQIREIKTFLSKKPIQSEKKFILIIDAHLLNESSSNCLLKTLEEPANGMFILLTSKINLLLDTIISRCQKIKFNSYTNDQIDNLLKENNKYYLENEIEYRNLIYISNGSPGRVLNNFNMWKSISDSIKSAIKNPPKNYEKILFLAKNICDELDFNHQELLLDYIQYDWWRKTKNISLIRRIETIKQNIKDKVQPKICWEIGLLEIATNEI